MVHMSASIVADGGTDVGGQGFEILEKLLGRFFLEIGIRGDGFVEVVDVGGVVFAVVEGHGLGIDVGLEGVGGVRERRKGEGAGWPSSARARQALLSYGGFRCDSGRREEAGR
jgi:hypothetical protein